MTNFQRIRALRFAAVAAAAAIVLALLWTAKSQGADCSGNFALQPGDGRWLSEQQLRLPGVEGLTIRMRPAWISKNGRWDFSFPDASVTRCRKTGDKYTLLLMGGANSPLAESNLRFYEQAAAALGTRYRDDPLCAGVHVTGASPAGVSEELHWKAPVSRGVIDANKRLINAWAGAFPNQVKLLATGGNDTPAMLELDSHGRTVCGTTRWLVKHNRMKAGTSPTAQFNQLIVQAGKRGSAIGWEMVGSAAKEQARFGGTLQQAFNVMDALTQQAGKPRRQTYRAIYPPDITALGAIK